MAKKFVLTKRQTMVEEYGALADEIKVLQDRADKLKVRLCLVPGQVTGVAYSVTVYDRVPKSLNLAKVKRLLGTRAYNNCMETGKSTRVVKLKRLGD